MGSSDSWADITAVYDKLLEDKSRLKDDRYGYLVDRADYLKWACKLQQWDDVLRLMKEFGNDYDAATFGPPALCDYYKRKAAKELGHKPL